MINNQNGFMTWRGHFIGLILFGGLLSLIIIVLLLNHIEPGMRFFLILGAAFFPSFMATLLIANHIDLNVLDNSKMLVSSSIKIDESDEFVIACMIIGICSGILASFYRGNGFVLTGFHMVVGFIIGFYSGLVLDRIRTFL